jgi:hypothetical protein
VGQLTLAYSAGVCSAHARWGRWVVCSVLLLADSDELPGLRHADKPVLVEAFVAECAVEALQEAVLHGLARRAEVQADAVLVGPGIAHLAGAFGSSVPGDALGGTVPLDELVEHAHHSCAGQ